MPIDGMPGHGMPTNGHRPERDVPGSVAPAHGGDAADGRDLAGPAGAGDAPGISLREARIEDLAAIVDLLADDPLAARREGGDLAPYAAAFARITADPHQLQVVAELGGQVVGTLQLSLIPSLTRRGTTRAQIEGVRTLSTLRGKGIGEALLGWALRTAAERGAGLVQLTSDATRGNAHRFYEHHGFVASHTGFKLELRPAARGSGSAAPR